MVYFTCNHCGESLKKANVDKHYMSRCRGKPKSVSCMDCQKDFYVEEYAAHTSCITEAEKYSGKNYVPKESKFAGKKKQENWSETIRSILNENKYPLTGRDRAIFQRLQQYENVPRKKNKFQNFIANCLKVQMNDAKTIWNILEMELQKLQQNKAQDKTAGDKKNSIAKNAEEQKKPTEPNNNSEVEIKEKEKQTKDYEPLVKKFKPAVDHDKNKENDVKDISQGTTNGTSSVKEANELSTALEKVAAKHTDGITVDKLKKKFLKKYKSKLQLEELTEKQEKKFQKKFRKLLNASTILKLEGDIVKVH